MLGNVALFVAACAVFLVVVYAMNKDSPKEVSPFEGGPAPSMGRASSSSDQAASTPSPSGEVPTAGGSELGGVVTLAPAIGEAGGGTLFIVVRTQAGPGVGPPLAVVRIEEPTFPAAFRVTSANVMIQGTPFKGPFVLSARLDGDGNVSTKAPGDLVSSKASLGVAEGTTDLQIVLDERI